MEDSPSKLAMRTYDKIAEEYHREFFESLIYKEWLDQLMFKLKKDAKVLDLGCGSGPAVNYLTRHGIQTVGVDLSKKMLELAKKNEARGIFIRMDFTCIGFRNHTFNAAISFFALINTDKKTFGRTISALKEILVQDGFLLLGMIEGEEEGILNDFYGKHKIYGACYSKRELEEIIKTTGYNIIKSETKPFEGKHFKETQIYILAQNNAKQTVGE